MVSLTSLWLPILISAVLVFVASFVIHMFIGCHAADYGRAPSEDAVMDALRGFSIPPGDYGSLPREAGRERPRVCREAQEGPVLMMTVFPAGNLGMGKQLAAWFVYCVVIGIFAAYLTSRALPAGAPYLEVFRFSATVAFVAYGMGLWQQSIWYRRKWATTIRSNIDALIYGLLTGGVFGWLWPS